MYRETGEFTTTPELPRSRGMAPFTPPLSAETRETPQGNLGRLKRVRAEQAQRRHLVHRILRCLPVFRRELPSLYLISGETGKCVAGKGKYFWAE
jgi:hypothetical protein